MKFEQFSVPDLQGLALTACVTESLCQLLHLPPPILSRLHTYIVLLERGGGEGESGRERGGERERECVCVRERESVCVRERESVCVCVCVCERERERERIH